MEGVARARILLFFIAIGCAATEEYDPADWYGKEQIDLSRYRRIVVKPVSVSVQGPGRTRALYVGSVYQKAFVRELKKGGRIEPAQAVGPDAGDTLILSLVITEYSRTRERELDPPIDNEEQGRWGYYNLECIELIWEITTADTGTVVAKCQAPCELGGGLFSFGGGTLLRTEANWPWYAESFAQGICAWHGIGPIPVKPTTWQLEVLAIERADVLRVARHLKLERAVDLDAVRFNHGTWGVPGNLDRIPAWESLTQQQRASLDAEVRVQEWFAGAVAQGRSLSELARILRRDAALSVYTLTRTLPEDAWDLEGSIGPCRIDYTLIEEIERGIEADGRAVGGVRIGGRAELIGAVAVRRIEP